MVALGLSAGAWAANRTSFCWSVVAAVMGGRRTGLLRLASAEGLRPMLLFGQVRSFCSRGARNTRVRSPDRALERKLQGGSMGVE